MFVDYFLDFNTCRLSPFVSICVNEDIDRLGMICLLYLRLCVILFAYS